MSRRASVLLALSLTACGGIVVLTPGGGAGSGGGAGGGGEAGSGGQAGAGGSPSLVWEGEPLELAGSSASFSQVFPVLVEIEGDVFLYGPSGTDLVRRRVSDPWGPGGPSLEPPEPVAPFVHDARVAPALAGGALLLLASPGEGSFVTPYGSSFLKTSILTSATFDTATAAYALYKDFDALDPRFWLARVGHDGAEALVGAYGCQSFSLGNQAAATPTPDGGALFVVRSDRPASEPCEGSTSGLDIWFHTYAVSPDGQVSLAHSLQAPHYLYWNVQLVFEPDLEGGPPWVLVAGPPIKNVAVTGVGGPLAWTTLPVEGPTGPFFAATALGPGVAVVSSQGLSWVDGGGQPLGHLPFEPEVQASVSFLTSADRARALVAWPTAQDAETYALQRLAASW